MEVQKLTCRWVRSGLTFGIDKLHVCCITHHTNLGFVPICEYHGGDLPIDKIMLKRQELLVQNVIDGYDSCKGCIFQNAEPFKSEYLFDQLNFSHYTLCNLRCKYCYIGIDWNKGGNLGLRKNYYDVMPALEQLTKNNWLDPRSAIYWGGGEPTLLRRFDEILGLLLDYGTYNFLNTNGTVFSQAIFDKLGQDNLHIIYGIDSGLNETYKQMKGKDFLDQVFENLKRYVSVHGDSIIVAKYIITDINHSIPELEEFFRRVLETGVKNLYIDLDSTINATQEHIDAMEYLRDLFKETDVDVKFCGCGVNALHNQSIHYHGDKILPSLIV
jgi:sulfatase maturation enzyme AslB (radical SAM superfamily)